MLLQCLLDRVVPRIRAVVLVPTRELVQQVASLFRDLTKHTPLNVVAVTGQHSFLAEQAALVPSGMVSFLDASLTVSDAAAR